MRQMPPPRGDGRGSADHSPRRPDLTGALVLVVEDGADCIDSGEHTLQLDVWSRAPGHVEAKRLVDAVKTCLHQREASLDDYALVEMTVDFRRVFDDPDGKTKHGVVTLRALVEEPE